MAGRRSTSGSRLVSAPSNIFLGVRKAGWEGREFVGDVRAFRVSSRVVYPAPFDPPAELKKDDHTLVLLDFAAATDAKVPDVSGKGRHGTVVGAKPIGGPK